MPRRDFERAARDLKQLEDELIRRLCAELRDVAAGQNTNFFFTQSHSSHGLSEHLLSSTCEELLKLAEKTIALRKLLVQPTDQCVGRFLKIACIENSDQADPQRLGPVRLAERLLSQIGGLQQSKP